MTDSYFIINGKNYKVIKSGSKRVRSRNRSVITSLTGSSIIQDFTNDSKKPESYTVVVRAYANQQPDTTLGMVDDLYTAMDAGIVQYTDLLGNTGNAIIDVGSPSWRTTDMQSIRAIAFVPVKVTRVYS